MTTSLSAMKQRAVQYLKGEDDFATFRDWFVGALADMDLDERSDDLAQFVDATDVLLIRRGLGDLTVKEFNRELLTLASTSNVTINMEKIGHARSTSTQYPGRTFHSNATLEPMEPLSA